MNLPWARQNQVRMKPPSVAGLHCLAATWTLHEMTKYNYSLIHATKHLLTATHISGTARCYQLTARCSTGVLSGVPRYGLLGSYQISTTQECMRWKPGYVRGPSSEVSAHRVWGRKHCYTCIAIALTLRIGPVPLHCPLQEIHPITCSLLGEAVFWYSSGSGDSLWLTAP